MNIETSIGSVSCTIYNMLIDIMKYQKRAVI